MNDGKAGGMTVIDAEAGAKHIDSLSGDPSKFLTKEVCQDLDEALAKISRTRREAESASGDLRLG